MGRRSIGLDVWSGRRGGKVRSPRTCRKCFEAATKSAVCKNNLKPFVLSSDWITSGEKGSNVSPHGQDGLKRLESLLRMVAPGNRGHTT